MKENRYKLIVHSPLSHSEIIRNELGKIGAGKIGNYSFCSFSYRGIGRYMGNENSNPTIGEKEKLEEVEEEVIEIVMEESILNEVIKKLKEIHPYEEPAYEVFILENI
jgi:hypothetical protein